jgi:hypothetical protein
MKTACLFACPLACMNAWQSPDACTTRNAGQHSLCHCSTDNHTVRRRQAQSAQQELQHTAIGFAISTVCACCVSVPQLGPHLTSTSHYQSLCHPGHRTLAQPCLLDYTTPDPEPCRAGRTHESASQQAMHPDTETDRDQQSKHENSSATRGCTAMVHSQPKRLQQAARCFHCPG